MSSPSPSPKRVAVLGSSFAGMTAALELRKQLDDRHEVVVLDPRDHFTFIPSLIWLPFGTRKADDITFPLAPLYERKGIEFVNEAAAGVDVDAHTVTTASGRHDRLRQAARRHRPAARLRENPRARPRGRPHAVGLQPRARRSRRRGLGPVPREPGPGRRRHRPGRLLLRRLLRVPLQRPPPDPQGGAGEAGAGHLHQRRALPRPLRPRRRRRLLRAGHRLPRPARDRGHRQRLDQGGARGRDRARGRPRAALRLLDDRAAVRRRRRGPRERGPRQPGRVRADRRPLPPSRPARRLRRRRRHRDRAAGERPRCRPACRRPAR